MIRVPRPEIRRALLMNEPLGFPTYHRYIESLECALPLLPDETPEDTVGGPAWQFLFECEVTGIQRVWGVENRALSSFDEPL